MDVPVHDGGRGSLSGRPSSLSASFEASEDIAPARHLALSFLADVREVHGLHVPDRVTGAVQLVVSELVTNALKYAPGPCLVTLSTVEGVVEVTVWDSEPRLPVAQPADPGRIGRHGLEIMTALCRSFEMHREPVGKRIVAAVALADAPVGDEAGDRVR
ncbi:ATP-binding protein [Streptomyces longwoodensis]|uniref:ATP-binding protein n=1 Tax=Streptomyces longwoodensis TaxID=68231 RepID=UPI002E808897|nr:ATP-binding protein [Streptomyces longwoodensis]WTI49237.1 ATP-binding protein [Streptomyces longwoodensis]WUC61937.1 ATP-binding protein [Streptomyces longwoodensis]WUC75504.1 ATP-binding protein [Streptomyces longwoodensis]